MYLLFIISVVIVCLYSTLFYVLCFMYCVLCILILYPIGQWAEIKLSYLYLILLLLDNLIGSPYQRYHVALSRNFGD